MQRVDRARYRHAYSHQFRVRIRFGPQTAMTQFNHQRPGSFRIGANRVIFFFPRQNFPAKISQGNRDMCCPEIDTEYTTGFILKLENYRTATTA
jgi:hypothetical protein